MPTGKPPAVRCVQLDANDRCSLFGDARRPAVCSSLQPCPAMCGSSREEAMAILSNLEMQTRP